jgi:hypothetical protein
MSMTSTGIRGFGEDDVPGVAALHRRVMRPDVPASKGLMREYRNYFSDVFLNDAALGAGLPSLVYERQGRIIGFLGVMPRRMQLRGTPLLAAVCSQFVVDPAERGQVGLQMLKRCFAGDQDVTISDEAGDCTRKIWEWCGGATALPYSIHWIRPLRPAQTALKVVDGLRTGAPLARVLSPVARAIDAIVTRSPGRFRPAQPSGSRAALDDRALADCLMDFGSARSLSPAYDRHSVQWVLGRVRQHVQYGAVRALRVADDSQTAVGWCVYHARRGGPGEVLQIAAAPRYHRYVLDHLHHDAWEQGVTMLLGRLEPAFAPELSENGCLLYRRGHWTLVHSKRPEVGRAFHRGEASFSRLEGEWCLRFC